MMQWESAEAIPLFERYLSSGVDGYPALVAQVNLAAALVNCERYDQAFSLLDGLIGNCGRCGHIRLKANCFEIRAQAHLRRRSFAECRTDLEEARRCLAHETTPDQLFILKWTSILDAFNAQSTEPIEKFRRVAVERRHWESVRDADFYSLKVRFDEELFRRLAFGTPYLSYRERLGEEFGQPLPLGESFAFGDPQSAVSLHLATGVLSGSPEQIPEKLRLMLQTLLNDFYKPASLGSLFADLFPDEHFNVFTSKGRVMQILYRTRDFLRSARIPAVIEVGDSFYSLSVQGPFAFVVPWERVTQAWQADWNRLVAAFAGKTAFSAQQAAEKLGFSRSQFLRLASEACSAGWLCKAGSGRPTRYAVVRGES